MSVCFFSSEIADVTAVELLLGMRVIGKVSGVITDADQFTRSPKRRWIANAFTPGNQNARQSRASSTYR
jgi:hypothetical protein